VTDTQISLWGGLLYGVLLLVVSGWRNKKLIYEQVGFTLAGAFSFQNLLPALRFIIFAVSHDPSIQLPTPLEGSEKYLFIAGFASEIVTTVSLYSFFLQACKVRP
jgi:hypothetical protein